VSLLHMLVGHNPQVIATGYEWFSVGTLHANIELRADAITAIMLTMVTGVSLLVSMFGSGYMSHDPGYPRFFAAVSLFVFSMCMLVLSGSFIQLFVFWEAVGLVQLSADRFLVSKAIRCGCSEERHLSLIELATSV
jgi:NADH:ubiquinone oxidoreductase subunit 5 (subunit L)/multisubunit Na+/H+ antiporter MnhA subunit